MAARTQPASPATGGRKTPGFGAHPAREHSVAAGKAARRHAPLGSHRDFSAPASRDPVGLLLGQAESRVPELVPVRHGRMLVSPFAYFRGAALPMAADLAGTRSSGLRVQLCGDAHLLNFGAFASPERRLVFDLNDFDETLPGPFEWDVKRLVASMAVAGRGNGLTTRQRRKVAVAAAAAYRTTMREFAAMSILDVWYARFDVEDALVRLKSDLPKKAVRQTKAQVAKARTRVTHGASWPSLHRSGAMKENARVAAARGAPGLMARRWTSARRCGSLSGRRRCGSGSARATRAPRRQRVSTSRATHPRDGALPGNRRGLRGAPRPPRPARLSPGHPRVTAGSARRRQGAFLKRASAHGRTVAPLS